MGVIKASVVVPVLNAGMEFEKSLNMIFQQKTNWSFEVIVIDSGSKDVTVAIARRFPVRLYEIDKKDFNHGLTRQWGVELARGDFIAFITQDAIPYDHYWLSSLVENLRHDEKVAGVYSRQIPKPACDPIGKTRVENWIAGQNKKRIRHLESRVVYNSLSPWEKRMFADFDDVSSCVKKTIMKKFPYSETEFGEDIEWSKRVIEAGYKIIYEPGSRVYHSHRTSIFGNYKRALLDHKRTKELFGVDFFSQIFFSSTLFLLRSTLYQIKDDFTSILKSNLHPFKKIGWMLYAVPMELIEKVGFLRGAASGNPPERQGAEKKRIVYVSHDFPPDHYGGVPFYTHNIAKELSKNNQVSVFYRKWSKNIPDYQLQSGTYDGLAVTSVSNNFTEKPNFMMVYEDNQIDRAFRKFLAEKMPDIVHFQFLGSGLSAGMVAVAKEYKIPTVLTLHDYWCMCPRGQMINYEWELCLEVIEEKCARCIFSPHMPLSALLETNRDPAFIDLLGDITDPVLAKAKIKTSNRAFVGACGFIVSGTHKYGLLEHPPSQVRYRVRMPKKSNLKFSICMPPETWDHREGDGVLFEILVDSGEKKREKVFSKYINPKHEIADQKWHDCRVDLSEFGEKTVDLIFTTAACPKGGIDFCAAGWGELRIVVEEAGDTNYGVINLSKKRSLIKKILRWCSSVLRQSKKEPRIFIRELRKACYMVQSDKTNIKQIRERNKHLLETLKEVDLLIAPSNVLREKFIDFGVPPEKIIYSNHGMNQDIVRKPQRSHSEKLLFGNMGTLMPTKGCHVLIDAIAKVPPDKAELRIYGDAPNTYHLDYVHLLKRKIRGRNNIKLMGKYKREDLSAILRDIDVLIVPSIWNEIGPLTIHEAFMAGVPVIASDIGGMSERVKHKVNGLLFKARDSEDLYQKIMMLIENPELIRELSAKVPTVKSIEENAKELLNIYDELIPNLRRG